MTTTTSSNERTRRFYQVQRQVDFARLAVEILGVLLTIALIVLATWPKETELLAPISKRLRIVDPVRPHSVSLQVFNAVPPTNATGLDLSPTNLVIASSHEPVVTTSNRFWLIHFVP